MVIGATGHTGLVQWLAKKEHEPEPELVPTHLHRQTGVYTALEMYQSRMNVQWVHVQRVMHFSKNEH